MNGKHPSVDFCAAEPFKIPDWADYQGMRVNNGSTYHCCSDCNVSRLRLPGIPREFSFVRLQNNWDLTPTGGRTATTDKLRHSASLWRFSQVPLQCSVTFPSPGKLARQRLQHTEKVVCRRLKEAAVTRRDPRSEDLIFTSLKAKTLINVGSLFHSKHSHLKRKPSFDLCFQLVLLSWLFRQYYQRG